MVGTSEKRRFLSFKGKGKRTAFEDLRKTMSTTFALRNWNDVPSETGSGVGERRVALDRAKAHLQGIALKMADVFNGDYPEAPILLRRNDIVSHSFLRWRFRSRKDGQGNVEFDDKRIVDLMEGMRISEQCDWFDFEMKRLRLNHFIALLSYEIQRLKELDERLTFARRGRRDISRPYRK